MCPVCGKPEAGCACRENRRKAIPQGDGIVRIRFETKGRKGRGVTLATGILLDADSLEALAKRLKQALGTGGTVKDGVIEIQGDHREALLAALQAQGHAVRPAGRS